MNNVLKSVGKFVVKNQSAILTASAVVGVIGVAVTASNAGRKAEEVIVGTEEVTGEMMPVRDQIRECWRFYVPTATLLAATIAAIVANHVSGSKKAAAAAVAYGLLEQGYNDYRQAAMSELGERKEVKIQEKAAYLAQDRRPIVETTAHRTGFGETLIYDSLSGRYFYDDMDRIRGKVNEFNQVVLNDGYNTLNGFYYELGWPGIELGHSIGWSSDSGLMEIRLTSKVLETETQACLVLTYQRLPKAL